MATTDAIKLKYPIESLAGIKGDRLVSLNNQFTGTGTPFTSDAIRANPNRLSLIIQNETSNVCAISLGPATAQSIALTQYGTYIIDRDNPWSGSIGISGINATVNYTELSVY